MSDSNTPSGETREYLLMKSGLYYKPPEFRKYLRENQALKEGGQ